MAGRGDHGALALVRRGDGDIAVVVMSYDCGHRAGQGFPAWVNGDTFYSDLLIMSGNISSHR